MYSLVSVPSVFVTVRGRCPQVGSYCSRGVFLFLSFSSIVASPSKWLSLPLHYYADNGACDMVDSVFVAELLEVGTAELWPVVTYAYLGDTVAAELYFKRLYD